MWELSLALVVILLTLWVLSRIKKFNCLRNMGIQGPKPSIWFGNLLDMISKTPNECLEEWISKYGDVMGYYHGALPVVVISDPDILKKIQVNDFQNFINRPYFFGLRKPGDGFSGQLIHLRDKHWKGIRCIMTPSFTTNKLKTMAPIINSAIDTFLQSIDEKVQNGEWFDIFPMYQALTMDVIGRTAFGVQTDCQSNSDEPILQTLKILFSEDMNNFQSIIMNCFPEVGLPIMFLIMFIMILKNKGKNPVTKLVKSVKRVIDTRRANGANRRQDLLQLMMDAKVAESDLSKVTAQDLTAGGDDASEPSKEEKASDTSQTSSKLTRHMTDEEILDNAVLFFLAGYETTSTALAFTTHFLLHYPEVQERVRTEIKELYEREGKLDYSSVQKLQYLDQVITESLRLYPPVYFFIKREVSEDISYGDIHLKKGTTVQVPVYNLQRNEKYWPEPHKFDPERFSPENKSRNHPFAYQVFGAGPRNCVGMRFAQMEIKLTLARMLLKYRFEKCDRTDKLDISLKFSIITLTPRNGVNMRAVPL